MAEIRVNRSKNAVGLIKSISCSTIAHIITHIFRHNNDYENSPSNSKGIPQTSARCNNCHLNGEEKGNKSKIKLEGGRLPSIS